MILRLGVVWHKLWLSFEMIPYHGFLWYRSVELPKYFFSCPWIPVYILYLHLYKKIQSVNWRECGYVYLCLRFKQHTGYIVHRLTLELLIFALLKFVIFTVCHLPSLKKKKKPGQAIIIFFTTFPSPFHYFL